MITKLYSFYDLPFDHDVCHLFEHVVLRYFLDEIDKRGGARAFFPGWIHGHTIDSTIFFDVGVYKGEDLQSFQTLLGSLEEFDDAVVSQSLAHIEAEMWAELTVTDHELLKRQFRALARLLKGKHENSVPTKSPIKVTDKPRLFHEVAVFASVYDISEDTRKVFLCLYPVLLDIIRDAALDNEAVYPTGTSGPSLLDKGIGVAQRYTIKKSVDIAKIEKVTQAYLKIFNVSKYVEQIGEYRASFEHGSRHNSAPIRFYEETGIETTKEELAQLATPERLQEIIDKMRVQIVPIAGNLKKVDWDN